MQSVKYLSNHLFVIFYDSFRGFACSFRYIFLFWLFFNFLFDRWTLVTLGWLNFCALGNFFKSRFFKWCLIWISWNIGMDLRFVFFRCKKAWLFDNRKGLKILRWFFSFMVFRRIQDKIFRMRFNIGMIFCLWNIFLDVSFAYSFWDSLKFFFQTIMVIIVHIDSLILGVKIVKRHMMLFIYKWLNIVVMIIRLSLLFFIILLIFLTCFWLFLSLGSFFGWVFGFRVDTWNWGVETMEIIWFDLGIELSGKKFFRMRLKLAEFATWFIGLLVWINFSWIICCLFFPTFNIISLINF